MDPLTILGATSTAVGLLRQGAAITKFLWDLQSKMKQAPESIRKQTVQVEQLLGLSRLFMQHTSLQQDPVASILGTCLQRAQEFQEYLKKVLPSGSESRFRRMKKSFTAMMKEKDIVVLADNLEREKTSLMCIQQIDK